MEGTVDYSFKSRILYKHGALKRGDPCLYKNYPATYLGSYKENDSKWRHMILIPGYMRADLPFIEEYITVTENSEDIICHQQMRPSEKNQMTLC